MLVFAPVPDSFTIDKMSEGEKDSDDVASTDEKKDENSSKGKSPVDRPLKDISEPHENDVLYGRGGK